MLNLLHKQKNLAEILYNNYSIFMYKVAYSILKDKSLAEDAVQISFIKIMKHLDNIDISDKTKTRNFLGLICKNTAINLYNKQKKQPENLEEGTIINETDVFDIVIDKNSVENIKKCIYKLKAIYQIPLMLHAVHGYSVNEIGQLLDLNTKTVQKRLERARQKIKTILKEEI